MLSPTAMPPSLLCFDLDGTLVDTAAGIAAAVNATLDELGLAPRPLDEIRQLIGGGLRELMLKLLARLADGSQGAVALAMPQHAALTRLDHHYARTAGHDAAPYPGALAALARLRHAGVRLACVTNKEARHVHRVLQTAGLDGCFDLVIAGDTLAHKKPHASVLRHVMCVLGCPAQRTAHVGDSHIDVQCARYAGVAAWAVPYGYNAGLPIETAAPDRVFEHLQQVADHVLQTDPATPLR
ncbi:HAD-IA family hydrolase [Caldimonas brevitalea]|uniref:phosphoglycolate phosphatase n=1 Tax=Caldimonas brevitalea TaxID=413882 RepID=A0A0G3BUQ7_9BURK|nr:HAD-IA family hydrolase [Caldimonas brevitalea]AKJ31753.1 phosphoglycolate phosphatase [Caldimonas brevitalea]